MTEPASDHRLELHRHLAATPERVFAAWTDPRQVARWMRPAAGFQPARAELDPRPGGRFRIVMVGPGVEYEHTGEYRVVEPPHRLQFTWVSSNTGGETTLVTVELTEHDGGTSLTLIHERLPTAAAADAHRGGWGEILERLARHLAGGGGEVA